MAVDTTFQGSILPNEKGAHSSPVFAISRSAGSFKLGMPSFGRNLSFRGRVALIAALVVGLWCAGEILWTSQPLRAEAADGNTEAYVALREAEYYERNGDYQTALARYQDAIQTSPASSAGRDAYLQLARLQRRVNQYLAAADTLRAFLGSFPDDGRQPTALYLLGASLQAGGKLAEAAESFQSYVAMDGVLSGYAHYQLGEIYLRQDKPDAAAEHFARAIEHNLPRVTSVDAMENLAGALAKAGNPSGAEAVRERALATADSSSRKAAVLAKLAESRNAQGRTVEARNLYLEVIQDYSWTAAAERALDSFSSGDSAVDDLKRGLVHFRNDRYEDAIKSLDSYLSSQPPAYEAANALYYKGLSHRYLGHNDAAIRTLKDMLALNTDIPLDGNAMWQLGWLSEISGRYPSAVEWYGRSAGEYPKGDFAAEALYRQGLNYYRLDDPASARLIWDAYVQAYPSSQSLPRVQFWLGKLMLEMGDVEAAADYLRSAAAAQNRDYYGVRAREYYEARVESQQSAYRLDITRLSSDNDWEREAFEEWLASWAGQSLPIFDGEGSLLAGDQGFDRLQELVRVGFSAQARNEIGDLREAYKNDPVALYDLMLFLRGHEFYQLSILTANDIIRLSPAANLEAIPPFLQKAIYPVPFAELILSEAGKDKLDPLLLTAIIRQESMFDQRAESSADARGLGQVMPSTGSAIAESMRMSDFNVDELFKPYISIGFGAYYFASNLSAFGGNPFFALAAYNAGPASVERWLAGNPRQDLDLFVEDVRFPETQTYVRRVYFLYDRYRQIWAHKD